MDRWGIDAGTDTLSVGTPAMLNSIWIMSCHESPSSAPVLPASRPLTPSPAAAIEVTVFERHRYAAMETSFANGGQLSASNAEVWNSTATVLKGLRWMLTRDAPLLMNPLPTWHKYSWMGEFLRQIPNYRANTIDTVRLAIAAREHLFSIAEREGIDFDLERRGILHIYKQRKDFDAAAKVNELLREGGLDRHAVGASEIGRDRACAAGRFSWWVFHAVGFDRRHPQVHARTRRGLRATRRRVPL